MRAFKFIDGKLVELTGWKDWPATIREMVAEEVEVVWEGHRIAASDEPRYPWLELWDARMQYDAEMRMR